MTMCDVPGCHEHYGCRLKNKGVQVSTRVHAVHGGNWRPSVTPPNKRRGELIYDERPGGGRMPILKPDGTQLRRHELEKDRHHFTSVMRAKNAQNTNA